MASRITQADGAFTAAGSWLTVDATSLLNSEANATASTIAYVESAAFTPGAITIDGIAVKIAGRAAAPTGTFSVRLAQAAATVAGTEVTINVTDIALGAAWTASVNPSEMGWYFFKFAAPVLLVLATAYTVSIKTSVVAEVTVQRNATAGNWCRMLRTTTGGAAPAAGDNLFILGEWTSAGNKTNRVITMDSTAATDYGDGTAANPAGCAVGNGGTLTWGTTAATNYVLQLSTCMAVYVGGTMTIGTTLTPVPRGGTAVLQFDCGADGDFGLFAYGTVTIQGLSRTAGKIFDRCKLNGDEAAAQTVLSVDTDTGWLNGDEIALASTTRTASQVETRILNGAAGATTVTVTAGLTNAHSGTAPTAAEMILLTRSIEIKSVSTSFMSFVCCGTVCTVDADWASFRYLAANAGNKRGIEIKTTTGSATFDYCSIRNFELGVGFYATGADVNNFAIRFCVGYLVGGLTSGNAAVGVMTATTGTAWIVTDVTILSANQAQGSAFYFAALNGTVQRIVASSSYAGIIVALGGAAVSGTCSDWTVHSNGNSGILLQEILGGTLSNLIAWRQNGAAQNLGVTFGSYNGWLTLSTVLAFGNGTANLGFTNAGFMYGPIIVRSATLAGDTTFSTGYGCQYPSAGNSACNEKLIFENCTFGVASGIYVAHTGGDIDFQGVGPKIAQLVLRNTLLASGTPILNSSIVVGRGGIFYEKKNQAVGVHQTYYPALGTIDIDTGTFKTAASEKLTPVGAGPMMRLRSQVRRIPVEAGQAMAVSVWVQKTAPYVGSAVRLVALANAAIGINADTVLDTMTALPATWEQLTGTCAVAGDAGVVEVVVECDGSAGSVYVDDWAAAVA